MSQNQRYSQQEVDRIVADAVARARTELVDQQLKGDIQKLGEKLDAFIQNVGKMFVKREEFTPVKRLVYGAVGVILIAVLSAILGWAMPIRSVIGAILGR